LAKNYTAERRVRVLRAIQSFQLLNLFFLQLEPLYKRAMLFNQDNRVYPAALRGLSSAAFADIQPVNSPAPAADALLD
jgi:hypothetical protein